MTQFKFTKTPLNDLMVINPFNCGDDRGKFIKYYEEEIYAKNGINFGKVYECTESISYKGVIRGLHYQSKCPQGKIVRVPYGEIMDVAVDLRKDSKTYGKYYSINLSDQNNNILYIPKGFAHGFKTLSDVAIVSYLMNDKYYKEFDSGIIWNDEDIDIDWQIKNNESIIISDRDKSFKTFKEFNS